jgi:23S rRNA (pseudouridine1915-N3)-methyltransferase
MGRKRSAGGAGGATGGGRELVVAWVGRHQRGHWEQVCARYRERIERVMPVRDLAIRSRSRDEGERRMEAEADEIRAALPDPCWLVVLDRRGKMLSSEAFAAKVSRTWREWPHAIAFVVGSDLGVARSLAEEARWVLSLSPMTFPHELARVLLYEQLYRAASLMAGTGYHRG